MPLQRRVPKFGFKNINRIEYVSVNLDALQKLADNKGIKEITPEVFIQNGLASKTSLIKVLGRGELNAAVTVKAHAFSATAKSAIEAKGGSATTL